jgi:hypothetical protein
MIFDFNNNLWAKEFELTIVSNQYKKCQKWSQETLGRQLELEVPQQFIYETV